jgi:pyruvate kinase
VGEGGGEHEGSEEEGAELSHAHHSAAAGVLVNLAMSGAAIAMAVLSACQATLRLRIERRRMDMPLRRTKIVATIGPASSSPEMLRQLIRAGMNVARLNFSHGSHDDHAATIAKLREASAELDTPVTILQDLQGPKIRVGKLPGGALDLVPGAMIALVPMEDFTGQAGSVPIDYPHLAEEATPGLQVLLDDGLLELRVEQVIGRAVQCTVVGGGTLKNHKGVNFPYLDLRLPSMTEKDRKDLEFGLSQGVDWISLSFVRRAADVHELRSLLVARGADTPIMAKIEKPQAIQNLQEIVDAVDGIMVARGDLGVEMSPEKVPMLQKKIIELCNRRGIPAVTATQMLDSMIREPRPTRAEASDVANAIIDGTDAIMLSGESAIGAYPVGAVDMMVRIAREVEGRVPFPTYPPPAVNDALAVSEAANTLVKALKPRCVIVHTTTGHTARLLAAERAEVRVVALTTDPHAYHRLNLFWGIQPLLTKEMPETFDGLVELANRTARERGFAAPGDKIIVVGGVPSGRPQGANFVKIHAIS